MTRNIRDGDPDFQVEELDESEECDHCGEKSHTMESKCPNCGKDMDSGGGFSLF